MSKLLIKGGLLITPKEERLTDLLIEADKIVRLGQSTDEIVSEELNELNAEGCYVTPGILDIQVNGGPGCDFWAELSKEKIADFSEKLIARGVTSILPTLITGDMARLKANRDFLKPDLGLCRQSSGTAQLVRMPGIHFEGPCLSPQKPGVHPKEHLKALKREVLNQFIDSSCKLVTLAPELDPSGEALRYLLDMGIVCSLGHSNATFEEAKQAFACGVRMMTHTFNALPALHHREPGAVGAALLDKHVDCCVIPDGLHLAPAMLELVVRTKGVDKTILVSDVAAIGTSQGGLVGSSLILDQGVRNLVKWRICNFADAIRMATYNPARSLKLEDSIGQIKPGAYADLLLWDRETLAIKQVIFNGNLVQSEQAVKTLVS